LVVEDFDQVVEACLLLQEVGSGRLSGFFLEFVPGGRVGEVTAMFRVSEVSKIEHHPVGSRFIFLGLWTTKPSGRSVFELPMRKTLTLSNS
jgi:hypothetical protein